MYGKQNGKKKHSRKPSCSLILNEECFNKALHNKYDRYEQRPTATLFFKMKNSNC